MQRAINELTLQLGERGGLAAGRAARRPCASCRKGVNQLVAQMRAEQKVVREWVDEQAAQQAEVAGVLSELAGTMRRKGARAWRAVAHGAGADYGEFWPGYVDVLSTLLLVVTFLMSIFMLAQYFVSQEASGKDSALRRLTRQIAELTNLLSLEKGRAAASEDELAMLQATLASLREENARLAGSALSGRREGQGAPPAPLDALRRPREPEEGLRRGAGQGRPLEPAAARAAPPDRRP